MSFVVKRFQGDTYPVEFIVRRGSSPYDLTGSTVELKIAESIPNANTVSMTATSIEVSKATFAPTADIYNLPAGEYQGQLQVTDANSYIWTPIQFPWKVMPVL